MVVHFDDEVEFEEVKFRAAKNAELGMAFTPSKKAIITREELGLDSECVFEITPTGHARISFVPISNAGQAINLQGGTWNAVVEYIAMLENHLPALQNIVMGNRDATHKSVFRCRG
jgi:hypothetical protein